MKIGFSVLAGLVLVGAANAQTAEQPMRDSTATLPISKGSPVPTFATTESRLAYLRWLDATQTRLETFLPDQAMRTELAQTAWYEAKRAGLDVALVLGSIEALSGFRRFAVASNGALGFMAINPAWAAKIGDGDVSKLMHMQTNFRFGCVVMRHYLDQAKGNVALALTRYVENNLGLASGNPVVTATVNNTFAARARWAFNDPGR